MYNKTGQQFPYVQIPMASCIMFPDDVLKDKEQAHGEIILNKVFHVT